MESSAILYGELIYFQYWEELEELGCCFFLKFVLLLFQCSLNFVCVSYVIRLFNGWYLCSFIVIEKLCARQYTTDKTKYFTG